MSNHNHRRNQSERLRSLTSKIRNSDYITVYQRYKEQGL
jgi:hypothetical protein